MKKHWLCAVTVVAATFGLSGVNAHAQDVTGDTSVQTVNVVPAEAAAPAAVPAPAPAPQVLSDNGKFVFFGGYSFLDTNITEGNDNADDCNEVCDGRTQGSGFALSGTYKLNQNFGLTADFSGNYGGVKNPVVSGSGAYDYIPQNSYYMLFGPTVSKRVGNVVLSAHALAGISRLWAAYDYTSSSGVTTREDTLPWATGLSTGLGGSVDWMFSHKIGWRIAQMDWLWSDVHQPYYDDYTEHNSVSAVRISTGIVLNFGGAR